MRKAEKEFHMTAFPLVSDRTIVMMQRGNRSANYAVFLAYNNNLYIRCFHRYCTGKLLENNRYVFTESGCCRYGSDSDGKWKIRKTVIEPVFAQFPYYTSYMNAEYSVIGMDKIKDTCMKYSGLECYTGHEKIMYLKFWQKHKAAEMLVKTGFKVSFSCDTYYNWNSTNLSDVLGLSKGDTKAVIKNNRQKDVLIFRDLRAKYPDISADRIFSTLDVFGYRAGEAGNLEKKTGLEAWKIAEYLVKNNFRIYEYCDYIDQCGKLGYNTALKSVNRPKNLNELHHKYTNLIQIMIDKENRRKVKEASEKRKYLEFQYKNLIAVLPRSADEIISEGKTLDHCVGSYVQRHAENRLSILFLRTTEKPDVPYYTLEVSTDGKIVQCKGFRNNQINRGGTAKSQDITDFEKAYQMYLDKIFSKNQKKSA